MNQRLRGVFVTGTDTGVGKTVVAAAVAATLAGRGERVATFKPVVTGLDEPGPWDHEVLDAVAPYTFGPPVSPHLAASLAGQVVDFSALVAAARTAASKADVLVAEGVGGLLVPLTEELCVRDLALALGLPVVVAARPGLGTINHTLLTLEAARSAGLAVAGVVLTPWPARPEAIHDSNRSTIERLGEVEVATLRYVPDLRRRTLARAASDVPVGRWLAPVPPAQRSRAA